MLGVHEGEDREVRVRAEADLDLLAGRRRGGKKHRRPPPTGPLVPPVTIATGVPVGDGDSELPVAAAVFEMDFDMD